MLILGVGRCMVSCNIEGRQVWVSGNIGGP